MLAASHPLCVASFCRNCRVDVGMERCNVMSAETSREKLPWMESSIWTACSGVAMRSVQDPVVPQQGHMPRLQQAKGHETGRIHQRVFTNCGLAAAGWMSLWKFLWRRLILATNRRDQPKLLRRPDNNWPRPRLGRCPKPALRILENEVQQQETAMKQAQPLGQKMDQARARFRRAVESGEKAMEALQQAQENFEQAQQEVMQAQTDLDLLMQEAPLPVMPVPQVNVSLVRTLEALTVIIENLWNPDAGQPPEHLIHAIQESRQILQTTSVIVSQEGAAALDARTGSRAVGSGRRRS